MNGGGISEGHVEGKNQLIPSVFFIAADTSLFPKSTPSSPLWFYSLSPSPFNGHHD